MTDNELIANALNATATDGSATTSSVPKDGAMQDALAPELWHKSLMEEARLRMLYQQEAAQRMAQQFDAQIMEQQRRALEINDNPHDMTEMSTVVLHEMATRTECGLSERDLEVLGYMVEATKDAALAKQELERYWESHEHRAFWDRRIMRDKARAQEQRNRQAVAGGRNWGKAQMFQQLYGAGALDHVQDSIIMGNGATLVLKDELTGTKQVPKSAGEAATNSLRDKFRKYNPFK